MRWTHWLGLALLAGLLPACSDEMALYRSDKHVPGYVPSGREAPALAAAPRLPR